MEGNFRIRNLYEKTLKIFKYKNSELKIIVLFLDLKLQNKSAIRFVL
jgi:hypothetical protein